VAPIWYFDHIPQAAETVKDILVIPGLKLFFELKSVIVHQAKQVQPYRVCTHALCQARIEQVTILVIMENALLCVPAHRHVVDCAWVFNS